MRLQLPPAPESYDARDQNALRRLLADALFKLLERNGEIEVGARSCKLVLVAANGARYSLGVDNTGALTTTLLT